MAERLKRIGTGTEFCSRTAPVLPKPPPSLAKRREAARYTANLTR